MSHTEDRDHWWKEGIAAMISGVAYGITNVISGSPMDVVKTKMQVCSKYAKLNAMSAAVQVMKTEGPIGFFRGCTGPLFGSSIFRAAQFASYEAFYGYSEKHLRFLLWKIPFTSGLEIRIILGGLISGTSRALIESPFEYTKVRRQVGLSWEFKNLYKGFVPTWLKAMGMMTTYFTCLDYFRRHTDVFKSYPKLFFVNGFCACIGFLLIWPIEIVKNQVQSENKQNYSVIREIRRNAKEQGVIKGLFRGIGPGLASVFIRNGTSMLVMQRVQRLLTDVGFRQSNKK